MICKIRVPKKKKTVAEAIFKLKSMKTFWK